MRSRDFLRAYAASVRSLPPLATSVASYFASLDAEQRDVLTTLLPSAATIRRRTPDLSPAETLEGVRSYCLGELDRVLSAL